MAASNQPAAPSHYRQPGWFTRNVFNRAVAGLTKLGVSVWGSRVLEVPGRSTGEPRRTPVNLLSFEDRHYLVSPRGHTQWVRNVRANDGRLDLLLGKRRTNYAATEVADADKTEIVRAYLKRWKAEVGIFFEGVDANSSDEEILAVGPKHPVFLLEEAPS
jgi:deazaflavin-dependent oxidoreductase (nitroreductase family)